MGGKLVLLKSTASSTIATVGSWANYSTSCTSSSYLKNGNWTRSIVFIHSCILRSPGGIIEQYQSPGHIPDELKQNLCGLGIGIGTFKKILRWDSFNVENFRVAVG